MRIGKLSCRKYLLFQNKGIPSRKKHKTGFSVLTTIELNLPDELTKSCKQRAPDNELSNLAPAG
jgi:hypothetical protein